MVEFRYTGISTALCTEKSQSSVSQKSALLHSSTCSGTVNLVISEICNNGCSGESYEITDVI